LKFVHLMTDILQASIVLIIPAVAAYAGTAWLLAFAYLRVARQCILDMLYNQGLAELQSMLKSSLLLTERAQCLLDKASSSS